MRSAAKWLAIAALLCGCGVKGSAPKETRAPEVKTTEGFFGRITPRAATPIHAPPNVFRIKGWNSRNSWIKLVKLVDDGKHIEAGAEVARFEFDHEDALPWIKKQLIQTEADLENQRAQSLEDQRVRRSDAEVKALAAESAELDTGKKGLVSDRDLALYELSFERAKVEEDTSARLLRASSARVGSELDYLKAGSADWRRAMDRYNMYEKRVHILAPHAGWVRYGYLNREQRKVQKNDGMPSGTPFLYIAEDERLSVEFLVPEHRAGSVSIGKKVLVRPADGDKRFEATVRTVDVFPQEVGFFRGDDELPDAHEKAYAVIADFEENPPGFSSGIEVRVEP